MAAEACANMALSMLPSSVESSSASMKPAQSAKAAKSSLSSIQERWDKAGDLPKADRDRLEKRLRAVEESVRSSEQDAWTKSAGTGGSNAFEEALARLQEKYDVAVARGDTKSADELLAQITSTKTLLGR